MAEFPLQRMVATATEYREDPPSQTAQACTTRALNDPLRPEDRWTPIPLVTDEVPVLWEGCTRK